MSGTYNLKRGVADQLDIGVPFDVVSADATITIPDRGEKFFFITKSSAAAITLGTPTTAQNGVILHFVSTTAQAHTITATTIGFNDGGTASDVCTFSTAKGNQLRVIAYANDWYVLANTGGTLA